MTAGPVGRHFRLRVLPPRQAAANDNQDFPAEPRPQEGGCILRADSMVPISPAFAPPSQ